MENPTYLYSLDGFIEFLFQDQKYRTICIIKQKTVNAMYKILKRDVIDLQTHKAVRLPYFTEVKIVSEISENIIN